MNKEDAIIYTKNGIVMGIICILSIFMVINYLEKQINNSEKYKQYYEHCIDNVLIKKYNRDGRDFCEGYASNLIIEGKTTANIYLECRKFSDSDYCFDYERKITNINVARYKEMK